MNAKSGELTILLIDDHPVVRKGMRSILEEIDGFTVCGEAGDGNGALRMIQDLSPNLAIVDINLKGNINGIELVKAVKERFPRTTTLVMSIDDGSLYAERAIRAGARGYISKDEASEMILTAIQTIRSGKIFLSNEISTIIASKHILGGGDCDHLPVERLSNRELEIFQLLGKGYKRKEISRKLNINTNTLESHRRKIREKLNIDSASELSKVAVQWQVAKNK